MTIYFLFFYFPIQSKKVLKEKVLELFCRFGIILQVNLSDLLSLNRICYFSSHKLKCISSVNIEFMHLSRV